jgi:anti-anti-sigma factor
MKTMTATPPSDPVSVDPVSVESRDGIVIVHVHGDIDMSNVNVFTAALSGSDDKPRGLVVDLSAARFFDSSGLRALFQIGTALQTRGGQLAIAVPPAVPLRRLLEISGADAIAGLEESVEAAIERIDA